MVDTVKFELLSRPTVQEIDDLLGIPSFVLDGTDGFIRVIDYMGNDAAVVQAARVSYGKGTKSVNEDRGLIRYLLRNAHSSPTEMAVMKFHWRLPMFVARQVVRHRLFSLNEYSLRYSEAPDACHVPTEWRLQSKSNKQGSAGCLDELTSTEATGIYIESLQQARTVYEKLISVGVAREQARCVLPISQYTEWYWSGNLRTILHFLSLRLDPHAQLEVRVYAEAIADFVRKWVPHTWEAFDNYVMQAKNMSSMENVVIRKMLGMNPSLLTDEVVSELCVDHGMSKRESSSFLSWIN
jgi:thymidylate synthase (FAD)